MKAASQANIDAITNVLDKQKERIDNIRQLLEEGGERAKNVSTELLEAEKNRQAELEKLRQQEIEKQQDYMVAQLAIQGSLAIAQAFVQYPFPASIGVAAATALAFFAQIAAIRATAQNQRVTAEKGGLVIEGGLNQRGRLIGNTHRNGGIQIEAESGEYIFSRRHSSEFDDIFNLIHNDKISRRDLVLKNDLFTQQRINDKKIIQNFNNIDLSSLKSELNEIKRVIEIKNYNLNLDGEKINKTISTKNKAKQATKDKASIIKKFKR